MDLPRLLLLLMTVGVTWRNVQGTLFHPRSCAYTCTGKNFIESLPDNSGPTGRGDNRAYAWAITSLIQTKLNVKSLSPPGSARITAIVGSCLYEAAVVAKEMDTGVRTSPLGAFRRRGGDETLTHVMDGAGYWALYSIFGDKPSFDRVFDHYQGFAGSSLRSISYRLRATDRFPFNSGIFDNRLTGRVGRTTAIFVGAAACQRVIEKYTADGFRPDGTLGSSSGHTPYQPVNTPQIHAGITDCDNQMLDMNKWQPLCVPTTSGGFGTTQCLPQSFLAPFAGRYTPFALEEGDENSGHGLVSPPPLAGSAQYENEWREVLDISAKLDDAQKIIAEYWADGPDSTFPPGHFWKIAVDAARAEGLDQSETARLLYIVGNALYDAGIASWRSKMTFDFIRPLQMIQCGAYRGELRPMWTGPYQGVGLGKIDEWRPYQAATFVTPPFAGYTSGHSTFSEAAAQAMRFFFGSDEYRGPSCHLVREGESLFEPKSSAIPGVTDVPNSGPASVGYVPADDTVLCWDTLTAASDQAGISRLFGGIHIRADDVGGKFMGGNAGKGVYIKAQALNRPSDF